MSSDFVRERTFPCEDCLHFCLSSQQQAAKALELDMLPFWQTHSSDRCVFLGWCCCHHKHIAVRGRGFHGWQRNPCKWELVKLDAECFQESKILLLSGKELCRTLCPFFLSSSKESFLPTHSMCMPQLCTLCAACRTLLVGLKNHKICGLFML